MKIWAVIADKSIKNVSFDKEVVFKGSKVSCRNFEKDNSYIYPKTQIKLVQYNNCILF